MGSIGSIGSIGGIGSLAVAGLGGFGGDAPVSGAMAAGLTSSLYAVADLDPVAAATSAQQMTPGAANLDRYAVWVRASLYVSDVLRDLDWTPLGQSPDEWTLNCRQAGGQARVATLRKPPMSMFVSQLRFMRDYRDQRADRAVEILTQPGMPADYFACILGLTGARHAHVLELMLATQVLAAHAAMIAKHHFACRRPDTLDPTLMPMIPTPGHNAYPSAHAAEAFAVATMLSQLVADRAAWFPDPARAGTLLRRQAERIAVNRTVAGMHYPVDSWAGAMLGQAVARMLIARCKGSGELRAWTYDPQDVDFSLEKLDEAWAAQSGGAATSLTVAGSPLAWLWTKASEELS
jgi:hypothetical protein